MELPKFGIDEIVYVKTKDYSHPIEKRRITKINMEATYKYPEFIYFYWAATLSSRDDVHYGVEYTEDRIFKTFADAVENVSKEFSNNIKE